MMRSEQDQELWDAVIAAEQQVARARSEFLQRAGSRRDVLADALRGSRWDRSAALSFLERLPDDVPELLDLLVDTAMQPGTALAARRAIAAGPRQVVSPLLKRVVDDRSTDADSDDIRRLAELLRHLGETDHLAALLRVAQRRGDPELLDIVEDFRSDEMNDLA